MREAYTIARKASHWQQWRPILLAIGVVVVVAAVASGFTALVVYRYGGTLFGPTILVFGAVIASAASAFAAAVAVQFNTENTETLSED